MNIKNLSNTKIKFEDIYISRAKISHLFQKESLHDGDKTKYIF